MAQVFLRPYSSKRQSRAEPFLMRDRASLQNLITIFYKIDVSRRSSYFCFSFKRDFFVFGKNNETSYVHFLWRREKNEKRHPPPPSRPLYWAGVIDSWQKPQKSLRTLHYSRPLSRDSKGMALKPVPLRGSPWLFIGWRMEKEL